jgi:hypothetical protein
MMEGSFFPEDPKAENFNSVSTNRMLINFFSFVPVVSVLAFTPPSGTLQRRECWAL